ncbi:MAG: ABC transporter ATP-binding protein [Lachnospiraceae bacterium]|nr:ABC transporter ATP-binding protein [Lachnospiraceae bacterium]
MIEVKDLVKRYGNHLAVDHLTFTVEKGEVLGFLGPNGAGKSTTMNMLTGYISATEGSIVIDGHDMYEEPELAKKNIGYLPELPPVYPDMTVREYLSFVADIKKVAASKKKEMIADVMKRTQVLDVADRLIKHLSKGYKQRVGLAQAIIGYPEVIILDEPTVGLDPMQIIEIRDLIKDLAKKHTVILSSHILSEVSVVCDKVMIINKGKLVVTDTPDQLSRHLRKTEGVELYLKNVGKELLQKLKDLENVEHVECTKQDKDGIVKVTVYTAENVEIRDRLFYLLAEVRCPIYGMNKVSMSLEDIFLELTQNDAAAKEVNDAEAGKAESDQSKKNRSDEEEVQKEAEEKVEETEATDIHAAEDSNKEKEEEAEEKGGKISC